MVRVIASLVGANVMKISVWDPKASPMSNSRDYLFNMSGLTLYETTRTYGRYYKRPGVNNSECYYPTAGSNPNGADLIHYKGTTYYRSYLQLAETESIVFQEYEQPLFDAEYDLLWRLRSDYDGWHKFMVGYKMHIPPYVNDYVRGMMFLTYKDANVSRLAIANGAVLLDLDLWDSASIRHIFYDNTKQNSSGALKDTLFNLHVKVQLTSECSYLENQSRIEDEGCHNVTVYTEFGGIANNTYSVRMPMDLLTGEQEFTVTPYIMYINQDNILATERPFMGIHHFRSVCTKGGG